MAEQLLTDEEIDSILREMIAEKEDYICKDWSKDRKRLFYQSTQVDLPKAIQIRVKDKGVINVESSVIFDTTDSVNIRSSYLHAITHYQIWQLTGSDGIFQFGSDNQMICITRTSGTFIFWFRFHTKDVGLVIDGQSGWVPGYLRRVVKPDGYIYGTTILFGSKELIRASKDKAFDIENHLDVYIVTKDVDIIDYRGNYDGSICRLHLSVQQLQAAIHNISSHASESSFHEHCHYASDILILFGPEAAKNFLIFQYTMESLCEDVLPVRIPPFLDATVIKYDKVSQSVFDAVLRSALSTNDEEASKVHFEIVRGAPFRKLAQCIEAYPILMRPRWFRTRFFLLDMATKFREQKKPEIFKRRRGEKAEELAERQRE